MTADGNDYLIASDDLSIYIQSKDEQSAKKMFEKAADMLFQKWIENDVLITQLRRRRLITKDVTMDNAKPHTKFKMPNLTLGHHENMQVAVC